MTNLRITTLEDTARKLEEQMARNHEMVQAQIAHNRDNEVAEHVQIRREIADAFDRTQARLWMVLGGMMVTVLSAAAMQIAVGGG